MYTQAMLDEIEKAIATGALEIQFQGRRIIYRNLEEMQQIRNEIKAQVEGTARKSRRLKATFRTGL